MNNNEILEQIKEYSDMNKLAFFVGAGISILSGYPSWYELVISMGDEIGYNYSKNYDKEGNETIALTPEEFLKIPQIYYIQFGSDRYNQKVKECFENECSPNEIHNMIMSLRPNHILTTNYDTLIEDAATKFGENYSVIASDKYVSDAETTRYLLKVHGELESDFVLKESDYLNYEFNYQLISNLMKTIFATNLVVFIGYSLDDYNIKLILNWMQNVQKETFVKPIFINTDDKKNDIEKQYYKSRGILVLDCEDFTEEKVGYLERYSIVLNAIRSYSPKPDMSKKIEVLDYLCNKISGIKNLKFIRRSDFNKIFDKDFKINDDWEIEHITHVSKVDNVWKDYFEFRNEYISIDPLKCEIIDDFINVCNVKVVHVKNKVLIPRIKIDNPSFNNNFDTMVQYCELEYREPKKQFEKAYYLSSLGKLKESYLLFTEVLNESRVSKNWDIYFIAQINRYHLYKKLSYARMFYAQPINIMTMGQQIIVVDEIFFKQMEAEMSQYDKELQFEKLPYYFKSRYLFLNIFSNSNCYLNEIEDLIKNKYEIEKSLNSYSICIGLSKFDKIKLDMLEAVKFAEDNMIYVNGYEESKNYIKNALLIWLRAYNKEVNKKTTGAFSRISNTKLKFELQDIVLLAKTCKKDDFCYFDQSIGFNNIPFEDIEGLKRTIRNLLGFYNTRFNDEILMTEYLWWREVSLEIQMLLYLSSYYLKDEDIVLEIIIFILEDKDWFWLYQDRMITIQKYLNQNNANNILKILGEKLIFILELQKTNEKPKLDNILLLTKTIFNCVTICKQELKVLSNWVINNQSELHLFTPAIIKLAAYLSIDAKTMILKNYELKTVWQLIERCKIDDKLKIQEYSFLIDEYIKSEIKENSIPGVRKHTIPSQEECIRKIIFFIIENNLNEMELSEYKGYWPEFDYFFNIESFNQEEFSVEWLLYYSDEVIDYIKKSAAKESIVKNALKNMDESKCKEYIQRWMYLYSIFI